MRLGRMRCPNCGIERGTDLNRCICGYNPRTGKIDKHYWEEMKSNIVKDESYEIPSIKDLREGVKENTVDDSKINNDLGRNFLQLCIDANINWLQYELIKMIVTFDFSEQSFDKINEFLRIGIENDIYNGVPRLCQGNKVIDISEKIKSKYESVVKNLDEWKRTSIHHILLGNYDVVYLMIDKF